MRNDPKKKFVTEMFDDISGRYDLLNTILSFGQDNRWRKKAVRDIPAEGLVIDLCGGGGQMAHHLLRRKDFSGCVVIADLSRNMILQLRNNNGPGLQDRQFPVVCDVERLPFKSGAFRGAMSGFSLRNLSSLNDFTAEVHRVVDSNGKARFLEIGHPVGEPLSAIFNFYFYRLSPWIARLFTSKSYAYRYLPNSLRIFPTQDDVLRTLGRGWSQSSYENIMGGIAAVYKLEKSGDGQG